MVIKLNSLLQNDQKNSGLVIDPIKPIPFNSLDNESLKDLLPEVYPLWIKLSSDVEMYRYSSGEDIDLRHDKVEKNLRFKPILLVNGYQSNHLTWNFFAQRLWDIGFRSIFALELNDYSQDEKDYFKLFENAIAYILSSLKIFQKIILIGHSMGGILSRYYIKQKEKIGANHRISMLITLGTPQYGFPKLSNYFDTLLKHIFEPEAVDVLSQDKGIYPIINTVIDPKDYLKLTIINAQGSLKRLAGGDGIFKPEPVPEMINIVEPRNHFRINKSHLVFNDLYTFLSHNAFIYKILLTSIDFSETDSIDPFEIFLKIKTLNEIEQRFPIEESIEVLNNNVRFSYPHIIFTGYLVNIKEEEEIQITIYKKKIFTNEILLDQHFKISFDDKSQTMSYLELQNQNQSVRGNFNIIRYKLKNML